MKRTDDFAAMVAKADANPAQQTVAMNFVDACRPLENGGASDIASISRAMLALAPMQLEIYLRPYVTHQQVSDLIARHILDCPGKIPPKPVGVAGWTKYCMDSLVRGGWPTAAVFVSILYIFKDQIVTVVSKALS